MEMFLILVSGAFILVPEKQTKNIQKANAEGIIHASIHPILHFLQRNKSLLMLNMKLVKKTKRYLSCTNLSVS